MKFSIGLTAALSAFSAVQGAVVTYKQVNASIAQIAADIVTVNKSINAFLPSNNVAKAFALLANVFALNDQILKTASLANQSRPFGNNGSNTIAEAILNLDSNDIGPVLHNIVAKKPRFDKGVQGISVSFIVLDQLIRLRNSTSYLASFVVPKLDATFQGVAPIVVDGILQEFDTAIGNYTMK